MSSGLYKSLVKDGLLIKHTESDDIDLPKDGYKVLLPDQIPLVSYPYEWSFSQLKDAALLTLEVQKRALDHGMTLKDASAYNVQFLGGQPVLIDTLSFEIFNGQRIWTAYRQFCQHFLAPLALMAQVDLGLNSLLRDHIDGIPLTLATSLLPRRKRMRSGLLIHLTMHNAAGKRRAGANTGTVQEATRDKNPANQRTLLALADSLERAVKKLRLPRRLKTVWGEYYDDTNYSKVAFDHKKQLLAGFIGQIKPQSVWDLGGNDGTFSQVALEAGAANVVCFDIDPLAVEKNYLLVKKKQEAHLLPLLLDLINPSPAIGWANQERDSLTQRSSANALVLALALIHHLAIANNLPFELIAEYFSALGSHLIVEFIPKADSKIQTLLATRQDIFDRYDQDHFEAAFSKHYEIVAKKAINDSERTLYLMHRL